MEIINMDMDIDNKSEIIVFQSKKPLIISRCIICKRKATYGSSEDKIKTHCFRCKEGMMIRIPSYSCSEKGCCIFPAFNYNNKLKGLYCKKHKKDNMVDVVNRKCISCDKIPNFNYKDQPKGIYCKDHAFDGMINVVDKKICKHEGCNKRPSYGNEIDKVLLFCSQHKLDGMIDLHHKKCIHCDKRAKFNYKELSPLYCQKHAEKLMINLTIKKCISENCQTKAQFSYSGDKIKLYCSKHKKEGMINLTQHPKCIISGCQKERRYNFKNEIKALYCAEHKLENMINIYHIKEYCIDPNCKPKKASFNYKGEKKAKYCKEHSKKDMVDLKNSLLCENCEKRATFNFSGSKKPIRCKTHREIDMVDVMNKKCLKCEKNASYGFLFHSKIHCAEHKSENEYLKNFPKCEIKNCKDRPYYSDTNYPKRCETHKLKTDTNIVEQKCKSCQLLNFINVDKGLCNDCFDFFIKKRNKTKEKRIGDLLKANNFEIESSDKIVVDGCSKYRPDYIIDFKYLKIIIEVDENQHRSYSCECEQGRMIQLHQDCGGYPVLFIRYNPDSYKNYSNKENIGIIQREKILIDFLKGFKNRIEFMKEWSIPLSVCYLFYDDYENPEIQEIKIFN